MHPRRNHKALPPMAVLLGLAGLLIQILLDAYVQDSSGLVTPGHPLEITLFVLAGAVLAAALYAARTMEEAEGYAESFPASLPALFGHILAALGIGYTVLTTRPYMGGNLAFVWQVLGFASVPCLVTAGLFRCRGKQPFFLMHLVPAVFLVVHAVSNYQDWSSEPQLSDYLFTLLGLAGMIFYAFYQSAFDADLQWRRKLSFSAYAAVGLGLMAVPGNYPWLYLGCSLWALLDRPLQRPRRRRRNPVTEEMV